MRKKFLIPFLTAILMLQCTGKKNARDPHHFPQNVELNGELANRIALTQKRLQVEHPFAVDFTIQDVARKSGKERRFEEYEGDISGRVLSAWSYSARLLNQRPAKLDSIASQVLQYQNPDGSFGKDQQPMGWDYWGRQLWGHGRLLVGLVEYYKLTQDSRFNISAEKLGDYLIKGISDWEVKNQDHHWFTNYTSLIESLMLLYEISPLDKYLNAAKKMAQFIPEFGAYHSHGYLISLVGLAKLYQHTGDDVYYQYLIDTYWRALLPQTRHIDGSVSEWFPVNLRTEGCSVVDWLRLNLQMWQITKDGIYIEEAERTWLNALNFHQTGNGAFGHALRDWQEYYSEYHESWWCCLKHGLFGYSEVVQHTFTRQQHNAWINFYHEMEADLNLPASSLALQMKTKYPKNGNVQITLITDKPKKITVHLRIPRWAKTFVIKVNGKVCDQETKNGYFLISRNWQPDDIIELNFPVRLRLEDSRGNIITKRFASNSPLFPDGCFYYGPLLLGADLFHNKKLPDKILFDLSSQYKSAPFSVSKMNKNYEIKSAQFQLPAMSGKERFSIKLVPICSQTGYSPWTAKLQNFIPTGEMGIQRYQTRMIHEVELIK